MKKIYLLQTNGATIGAYTTRSAADLAYRYFVEIIGYPSTSLSIRSICLETKEFFKFCLLDEDKEKLGI